MWVMKGQGTASIVTSYLRVTLYASKIKHNLDYWTLIALIFLEQRSLKIHIKSFCSLEELIKAIYWDIPSIFKLVFWSKKITKVAHFFHDIFLVTQC